MRKPQRKRSGARQLARLAIFASLGGAAIAQTPPLPPRDCYPFACPPRPSPYKLPSDEVLALANRLAAMLDLGAVAKRANELVKMAQAKDPPAPVIPTWPNGPIRAVPPVDLANYPMWGIQVQQRVIEHAALVYARKYSLEQLRQMVSFFESPAGQIFLTERRQVSSLEVEEEIGRQMLEHDLWNVVCGIPVPSEVEDGPHHQFHRLHPPMEGHPKPPPRLWCADIEVRSRYRP